MDQIRNNLKMINQVYGKFIIESWKVRKYLYNFGMLLIYISCFVKEFAKMTQFKYFGYLIILLCIFLNLFSVYKRNSLTNKCMKVTKITIPVFFYLKNFKRLY